MIQTSGLPSGRTSGHHAAGQRRCVSG